MKKTRRNIAVAFACLFLTGCAVVFPHTSEAIAPATFEDFWAGMTADIQQWLIWLGL